MILKKLLFLYHYVILEILQGNWDRKAPNSFCTKKNEKKTIFLESYESNNLYSCAIFFIFTIKILAHKSYFRRTEV